MKTNLSHSETVCGWFYFFFYLFLLPSILTSVNGMLPRALSETELNFVYFFINFLVILWIFHDFLGDSVRQVTRHPVMVLEAVILGGVAYFACQWAIEKLIFWLAPGFANANDASIGQMLRGNSFLMTLGTVVLVPPVEECMYRGLIFRKLYGVSKWAAYLMSIAAFALIHVIGFIGSYSPLELCLAVLQYLPAGLCLGWAYVRGGTIFAPIFIHAIVNAVGIYRLS